MYFGSSFKEILIKTCMDVPNQVTQLIWIFFMMGGRGGGGGERRGGKGEGPSVW